MSENLKTGDRVRIRSCQKSYVVAEIHPPGCMPYAPSTVTLRLTPENGKGPEQLYGNATLVKVP
jgi:hypothetical protein